MLTSYLTRIGIALFLLIALCCLFGPLVHPLATRAEPFLAPSWQHPFGTDDLGQDVLAGILIGGRTSLFVGLIVGLVTTVVGVVVGGLAGYHKSLDVVLMRLVDLLLVIPRLPLLIFLSLLLKPSVWNVIVLLSVFGWPMTARSVRPLVKALAQADFVTAARSLGGGHSYIFRRHLLPQLSSLFVVQFVLEARYGVMAESGLGFLGLEDPTTKSWGMMLAYAFNHQATFVSDVWRWTVLPPALALTAFLLSLSLMAAGMEGAMNPRIAARPRVTLKKEGKKREGK
ncbi:MAG TPA: ABC transporter permease [Blastocatellia bacterium]|nr:ABC transporter permease [Blastocatellia bacterium]